MRQRHSLAEESLETVNTKLAIFRSDIQNQEFQLKLNSKIKKYRENLNSNAIKIQKAIRGWLVRKNLELDLINLSKNRVSSNILQMQKTGKFCLLNIGASLKEAATKIQKFIRRQNFYQKIKRLQKAYALYLETLKEPLYQVIKKGLRTYFARQILININYEKFKTSKLEKIKRKLAIIKIKKIFKKKKLSFKIIKNKIKRFKKLAKYSNRFSLIKSPFENNSNFEELFGKKHKSVILSPSKDLIEGNPNQINLEVLNLPLPEAVFNFDMENKQIAEDNQTIVIKQEFEPKKKRRKKVLLMKKVKNLSLIPLLYQRELEERPNTHHFMRTTASITRMVEATPTRSPPKFVKNYRIRVQSAVNNFH